MTIIELSQGRYRDLSGTPKLAALAMFIQHDIEFVAANPSCAKYHQPAWRELVVADTEKAPWGYEWYIVDEAGLLKMHSAQYDSSG